MANSMFNIYDTLKTESDAPRQAAIDYSKIREGGVAAAVMAQTAGMLGGQAMEAAGYQTAGQMQAQAMNEVKALYPNPTTRQEFIGMANEFKNRGMMDLWKEVMDQADSMAGGTDQKKWDFEQRGKRDAIKREAESRNYTLTESEINDIAIATPLSAKLNQQTGLMIHPWMDLLNAKLATKDKNKEVNVDTSAPTPSAVSTAAAPAADISDLQAMNTQFGVETKALRENISTIEAGLNIVNQVRGGNTSSMPQLERMLAKFNSDNRISVPEVKQVMKIGGLGERITDSITRFLSGELSPGTLNDIEEMLTRMGQLDQKNYNSKVSDYQSRYSPRFDQDTLSQWIKPSDKKFYTQEQQRELWEQAMKKRGLK